MGLCQGLPQRSLFIPGFCPEDMLKYIAVSLDLYGPFVSPLPTVKKKIKQVKRRNFYPILGSYAPIPGGEDVTYTYELRCLPFDLIVRGKAINGTTIRGGYVKITNLHCCTVVIIDHDGREERITTSISSLINKIYPLIHH